ncbi:MAG: SDR family oxidoreductase [Actinomycetia bacterium]|nr:SDR family oxidoreductase [Actinomycetes bacterium]
MVDTGPPARRLAGHTALVTGAQRGIGRATALVNNAGIVGFTHTAAVELGALDIRINSVAPGLVDTAQPRDGMTEAEIMAASDLVPRGQMAMPADIADVVVFLLSNDARHITGQTLHVNGGQYTV